MKAILVIDMPNGCANCLLKQFDDENCDYFCAGIQQESVWIGKNVYDGGKHEKCPLKEVSSK